MVHPEYEENSDRDGTRDLDTYDNPDSEWELMLQISLWQVESSTWVNPPATPTTTITTTTSNETTPLQPDTSTPLMPALAVSDIIIVAVIAIEFLKKR